VKHPHNSNGRGATFQQGLDPDMTPQPATQTKEDNEDQEGDWQCPIPDLQGKVR